MNFPYLTMIKKYKNQYILEGCSFKNNFKIIIHQDNLFGEEFINIQKISKNFRPSILTFFELSIFHDIDFATSMKLYKEVC